MHPLAYLNKKQIKEHLIIWIFIVICMHLIGPIWGVSWTAKIVGGFIEDFNYLLVFYGINLLIFPNLWLSRRIFLLVISIFICYGIFTAITYINYLGIIPYLGGESSYQQVPVSKLIIEDVLFFFLIGSAGMASFFNRYNIYKYQIFSTKEKSLLVKQVSFLKNQFNSHITFNFLNYCYINIYQKLPELAESISIYSDILRYSLEKKPNKKVALTTEIEHIENFITLQKVINTTISVEFEYYKEDIIGKYILPHILSALAEKAFEGNTRISSTISIIFKLQLINNQLLFTVKKTSNSDHEFEDANIRNVKQTLDLFYTNNYELIIENNEAHNNLTLIFNDVENQFSNVNPSLEELNDEYHQSCNTYNEKSIISNKKNDQNSKKRASLKSLMHLDKQKMQRHIFIWFLVTVYASWGCSFNGTWGATIVAPMLLILGFMFVFYSISLYAFPKFWGNNRLLLFVSVIVIIIIFYFNRFLVSYKITPTLGGKSHYTNYPTFKFIKINFYYLSFAIIAAVSSFFSRYAFYKSKLQTEKEKSLLSKELNFLKDPFDSQLSFEFLELCRNKAKNHSLEVASSIELFINMLKYTFQVKSGEKTIINNEVMYIENFIRLQRLLNVNVYANFSYKGPTGTAVILPRILITFVENAFKHGVFNDSENPIHIILNVSNNTILFTVNNKIRPTKRAFNTNTGLENVKQILNLFYTNKFELQTEEKNQFYSVKLTINL